MSLGSLKRRYLIPQSPGEVGRTEVPAQPLFVQPHHPEVSHQLSPREVEQLQAVAVGGHGGNQAVRGDIGDDELSQVDQRLEARHHLEVHTMFPL